MAAILRHLFWVALCAGLLSGLVATAAHQLGTVPLILAAEQYEQPAAPQADHAAHAAWQPEDGLERTGYTLLADMLTGIGYALLLCAGLALRGDAVTWHLGLLWGLAGFAVFSLAPGLGLPPELPGAAAAPLLQRQWWWLATVLATGAGLALLAFSRRPGWSLLAVLLIALPHVYGAPQPAEYATTAPASLTHRFAAVVMVGSLLSWAALGAAAGYLYPRLASSSAQPRRSAGWS